jgi:hypothetical protein
VSDPGPGFPVLGTPEPNASGTGGYGLTLVARLSSRWGAEQVDGAMMVWFELDEDG